MHRIPPSELPYNVDAVDIVAEFDGLIISEITISPGQEVPWHYHSNVTDSFYCISGCTEIRHGPTATARLRPGESFIVPPHTAHRVQCSGDAPCRFLIVQGIGEYDFVPTQAPQRDDSHG